MLLRRRNYGRCKRTCLPHACGYGAERGQEENPAELTVLVDNQCAVENVTRFAGSHGYKVAVKADGEDFTLTLTK